MSRNSPKMLSRGRSHSRPIARPAMAGDNQTPQPLTPGACIAAGIKPPVSFNGSGRRPQASRKPKSAIRLLDR